MVPIKTGLTNTPTILLIASREATQPIALPRTLGHPLAISLQLPCAGKRTNIIDKIIYPVGKYYTTELYKIQYHHNILFLINLL
jgi:hypothetical protein